MDYITSLSVDQIAYPVGPKKDAYYLYTYFKLNIETNIIQVESKVVLNFYARVAEESVLFKGTAKECLKYVNEKILTQFTTVIDEFKRTSWIEIEKP